VVRRPNDAEEAARVLARLLDDADFRRAQGEASRKRAVTDFSYDVLARRLDEALQELEAPTS
jgi:glycosyltransferase involved in cell wall biosynthesis